MNTYRRLAFALLLVFLLSACVPLGGDSGGTDIVPDAVALGRNIYSNRFNVSGDTIYYNAPVRRSNGGELEDFHTRGLWSEDISDSSTRELLYEDFLSYLNIHGNTLYFINGDNKITTFSQDTKQGSLYFDELHGDVLNLFIIDDMMYYIVEETGNNGLFAHNLRTNTSIKVTDDVWFKFLGSFQNSIVFIDYDGVLKAWEPESGTITEHGQFALDTGILHIMDDGVIIASSLDISADAYDFFALTDNGESREHLFRLDVVPHSIAVTRDGIYYTVYASETENYLFFYSFSSDKTTDLGEVIYPGFELVSDWLVFASDGGAEGIQLHNIIDGKKLMIEEKPEVIYP